MENDRVGIYDSSDINFINTKRLSTTTVPGITSVHNYRYYTGSTEELQWLDHLWKYENMSETGVVRANQLMNHSAKSGGILGTYFQCSLR